MYEELIDRFMPSQQMREYLKSAEVELWQIADMVANAPCPLADKLEGMQQLLKQVEQMEKAERQEAEGFSQFQKDDIIACIKNIEEVFKCLEMDGICSVEEGEFDQETLRRNVSLFSLYTTYEDAMEAIREYEDELDSTDEEGMCRWYELKKWTKDQNGKLYDICSCVVVKNELWYGELTSEYEHEHDEIPYYLFNAVDINLPVPFKPGDIVEADGSLFGPKIRILFMEVGDNHDCCSLQGLARKADGTWEQGAIKHGVHVSEYYPPISPLYTMHLFEGELPREEQLLLGVQEYLQGDESRSWPFEETCWHLGNPVTDDVVKAALKQLKTRVPIKKRGK